MGLIFSILLLGLMASLSPATIIVFILVLGTARARVNAAAFLVGWAISLTVVFSVSYRVGSSRSIQHGSGRTGVLVLEVALGCALVAAGVRQWRRRGKPLGTTDGSGTANGSSTKDLSGTGGRWGSRQLAGRLNDLGPVGAAVVGVLKQPWAATAAAAVVVVHHHEALGVSLIAFACFTVVSTASVGSMYLYYARRPGPAQAYLSRLRERAAAAGPTLLAVAAILIGAFLLFDGVTGLRG